MNGESRKVLGILVAVLVSVVACSDDDTGSLADTPDTVVDIQSPDVMVVDTADKVDVDTVVDVEDTSPQITEPVRLLTIDLDIAAEQLALLDTAQINEATCKITVDGIQFATTTLELHGGNASKGPKKSYRVVLPKIASGVLDLFGEGPETTRRFVLNSSGFDATFIRNKLTLDAVRIVGGLAPRVAFAVVTIQGDYHGLFTVIERIDKDYLENQGFSGEGNLYKAETSDADWSGQQGAMAGFDHELVDKNAPDGDDLGVLFSVLQNTPTQVQAFIDAVEPQLDLVAFMNWQLVHVLANNVDTFRKNYYLYHEAQATLPFTVISWDADATWGQGETGEPVSVDGWQWYGTDRFAPRLFSIQEYRTQYLELFEKTLSGALSVAQLVARVDHYAAAIRSEAMIDLKKWRPEVGFDDQVGNLKSLIKERHESISGVISALE